MHLSYLLCASLNKEDAAETIQRPSPVNEELADAGANTLSGLNADQLFEAQTQGLELLGFLAPMAFATPDDILDTWLDGVVALYLSPPGEIIILETEVALAGRIAHHVLAHKFVHALQDQQYSRPTPKPTELTHAQVLAALCILEEGEAMLYPVLRDLTAEGFDLDRFNYAKITDLYTSGAADVAMVSISPFFAAQLTIRYTHGARYVLQSWVAAGQSGVDALFAAPPQSTLQVMLDIDAAPPTVTDSDSPEPLEGYVEMLSNVAGARTTLMTLTTIAGPP